MTKEMVKDIERRMSGALTAFHNDLKGLRTGRASAALLESVKVEVYGSKMPLDQVASISVPEPRMITVQVWDQNNASLVEKAIANSGLGLNPVTEGALVRVPIPDLSEDRRKELVKVAHQYAEKGRVAVRNVRRDGMDQLKKMEKDSEISKDEQHDESANIQKITDNFIKQIDDALQKKEGDILSV